MRVWRTNSVFFSPCCSGTDGGCILTKRIGAAKQLEHQKRPNKLSGDVKDEWDLFAKKKKKTIPGNRSRLELFSGLALRGVSGSVAQCLKNPAQYQNPYGSQLPMQGRTHTIPHMRVLRGRDASTQKRSREPSMHFYTHIRLHTHTHGGGGGSWGYLWAQSCFTHAEVSVSSGSYHWPCRLIPLPEEAMPGND